MVALVCVALAAAAAFLAAGTLACAIIAGAWAVGLLALLVWLAVDPSAQLFPAAWWALAALGGAALARLPGRLRRA